MSVYEEERYYPSPEQQSLQKIKETVKILRSILENRLEKLDNKYHNKKHAENVATNLKTLLTNLENPNLFTEREKLLLEECALRHDDGHSGNPFRQDVSNDFFDEDLSNEEYAAILAVEDFQGKLADEDINFIVAHILPTAFGQNDESSFLKGKKHYYRSYKPESDSQRLLALADVLGFMNGWDNWVEDSFNLCKESKQNMPNNVDEWIKRQKGFIVYIDSLLKSVESLFKKEYFTKLTQELDSMLKKLSELENLENLQRAEYENRLKNIRSEN